MKYTRQERLTIGRSIFDGTYTVASAAEAYGISFYTAREYLRTYKAARRAAVSAKAGGDVPADEPTGADGRPWETDCVPCETGDAPREANGVPQTPDAEASLASYRSFLRLMTRDELEKELVEMRVREEEIRRLLG